MRFPLILLLGCCGLALAAVVHDEWHAASRRNATASTERTGVAAISADDMPHIRAIQKRGGRVFVNPQGQVVAVRFNRCIVRAEDLRSLLRFRQLDSLSLRAASLVGPDAATVGLRQLERLPRLRLLDLSYNREITNQTLASIGTLRRLEVLNLSSTAVTNAGLPHLQSLRRLRWLGLPTRNRIPEGQPGAMGCTAEGLPALWGLPIEELSGVDIRLEQIPRVSGLDRLRRWNISWDDPDDASLPALRKLTRLPALSVSLSRGWQDTAGLRDLAPLQGLHTLEIGGRPETDEPCDVTGLAVLEQLPNLERLRLLQITDEGLAHLPPLRSLRALDLTYSRVAGAGLAHLQKFPALQEVAFNPTTLAADGLSYLPRLPRLERLHLNGLPLQGHGFSEYSFKTPKPTRIDDTTLASLRQTPNLSALMLGGLPITDAGLAALKHVPQLESLSLSGIAVTDAAFVHLRGLEHLEELEITGTQISYQAAQQFYELRESCYISDNWCCGCMSFGVPLKARSSEPATSLR